MSIQDHVFLLFLFLAIIVGAVQAYFKVKGEPKIIIKTEEEVIDGYHAIGYLKACEDFRNYLEQTGFSSEVINDAGTKLLALYRERYPYNKE